MAEPIRTCPDHGPYSDGLERCPACGAKGDQLLSGQRRRQLSKFVSGALRHFPADVGLELDERGWTTADELVSAVERKYDWAGRRHVAAVISTDPKGRFERTHTAQTECADHENDALVRASYGHSVDVTLEPTDGPVPDVLYHGTAPENLESIREAGLQPMARQQVHLSASLEAAHRVGSRHASEPVVLVVDAAAMLADDHRITKRGRETYTVDEVASSYLSRADSES
ncbi:RNA 2'-phosphotransferase [Natrialbaceae archaeon A-arb3/5]